MSDWLAPGLGRGAGAAWDRAETSSGLMAQMRDPVYPRSLNNWKGFTADRRSIAPTNGGLAPEHVERRRNGTWWEYKAVAELPDLECQQQPNREVVVRIATKNDNDPIAWSKPGMALVRSLILRAVLAAGRGQVPAVEIWDTDEVPCSPDNTAALRLDLKALAEQQDKLTFHERLDETFVTLYRRWQGGERYFIVPYGSTGTPDLPAFQWNRNTEKPDPEDGTAFGASGLAGVAVFTGLAQARLITYQNTIGHRWTLTAAGIARAEQLDALHVSSEGFLIRNYALPSDHSSALTALIQSAKGVCPIRAVWEVGHNDKIDDRILRKIRESALVVVDVPPKRSAESNEESHNVGLEHGYALALGKPTVHVQYVPKGGSLCLPFDIQSQNVLAYGPGSGAGARDVCEIFKERVRLAVEAARMRVPPLDLRSDS